MEGSFEGYKITNFDSIFKLGYLPITKKETSRIMNYLANIKEGEYMLLDSKHEYILYITERGISPVAKIAKIK